MHYLQDAAQKISHAEGMVRHERLIYKLRQSRITPSCSGGFSLVCSAEVLFCPPRGLQEFTWAHYIAGTQGVSSVLLRVKLADHRGANVVTSGKRYSNSTLLPTAHRASTHTSLPISGNLKRCPVDLRAGEGGDLDMTCPGLHCLVWSWLSRPWTSLALLSSLLPSPWAGSVAKAWAGGGMWTPHGMQHPCRDIWQIHPSWSSCSADQGCYSSSTPAVQEG